MIFDFAIAVSPVILVLVLSAPGWLTVRRERRRNRECLIDLRRTLSEAGARPAELAALDEILNRRRP